MRGFAALVVIAACSGSPHRHEPLAEHDLETIAPRTTAPPFLGFADSHFAITGLPAVARAGELVVVPLSDSDAGRGFPNLRLETRDRNDKLVQKIDVLISNDYEAQAPDGKPGPVLDKRIADVNHELAKLHGVHDLEAMHKLELEPAKDGDDKHFATGDGLDVDWSGDHLHVFHHNADHPLVTLPNAPWLVPDHKPCASCEVCSNPAYLDAVYHTTDINVLVIEIAYHGTDTCWEPGHQLHVVSW